MEGKESKKSCDQCGADDAVVHLTQIVSNEMKTSHLCEKCAAVKGVEGVEGPVNFPLTGFLAQLTDAPGSENPPEALGPCSFCGLTFENFREAGRLGCPHCYTTYESYLRGLLRRVHGSTQHLGKVYLPPDPAASDVEKQVEVLRHKLQRAVDSEDFERAAGLRDKIRGMEPAGTDHTP
jgi:protein arginine kinase activator